ncbi:Haloacid dehalogenase hydrolase (HAD) superfamily protein [Trifolium repens]|nr:Haloacid dehalogenase hydrolase (HAD) superfamily protein [Trifolium repens]
MNFLLNQDQCRKSTAMTSKENNEKPVYSASNTLMIGDKPYKAYLNPDNTGIFVESYDPEDNALGVAEAEDVQSYVENNPFGIPAITEDHPEWSFYSKELFSYFKG